MRENAKWIILTIIVLTIPTVKNALATVKNMA